MHRDASLRLAQIVTEIGGPWVVSVVSIHVARFEQLRLCPFQIVGRVFTEEQKLVVRLFQIPVVYYAD